MSGGKKSKQMTSGCPLVFHYLTECCKEMRMEMTEKCCLSVRKKKKKEEENVKRQSNVLGRGAER